MAKEMRIKMSSRYRRTFAVSLFLFAVRFSFCFESFSFCRDVFLLAASLFLFAARWSYSFCCVFFFLPWGFSFCSEVNAFAVTVLGHRTKVRQTTSNWIVRILLRLWRRLFTVRKWPKMEINFNKYKRYFVGRPLRHTQLVITCEKCCLNHHHRLIHFPYKK